MKYLCGAILATLLFAGCGQSSGGAKDLATGLGDIIDHTERDFTVEADAGHADLEMSDLVESPDLTSPRDLTFTFGCGMGPPCPPKLDCCMMGKNAGNCYDPACLACCM